MDLGTHLLCPREQNSPQSEFLEIKKKGLVNRHYLYSYSTRMGLSLNHYGSLY